MFQCKTVFFQLRVEISTLVVLVTVLLQVARWSNFSINGFTLVVVSLCVFDFGAIKVQELRS